MAANPTYVRRAQAFLQMAFALVIFLSLNYLGNAWLGPLRVDLTEDHLFSLSPGAEAILASLEEPLTLKFYFSETVAASNPSVFRYGRRVQDLLEEFAAASNGAITLEVIDPLPFSTEKDAARSYGLQGIATEEGEVVYLGLVGFDDTNRLEVIANFSEDRERFLEFDVAKIVFLLTQAEKPKVGLLTGLPMRFGAGGAMAFLQGRGQPYLIYNQLSQFFNIVYLENDFADIPPDLDVLLIVHPPPLSAGQLYQIDQFILGGTPAMIFVDPFAEVSPLMQTLGGPFGEVVAPASDMALLFEAWGIHFNPDQAVVDHNLGQTVEVGEAPDVSYRIYIHWLGLGKDQLSEADPITADLSALNFASSGALAFDGRDGLSFTSLVQTTGEADLISADLVREDVDSDALIQIAVPEETYTLIGRLSGAAQTAFPEGFEGQAGQAGGNINVIIGADADFFEDRFWAGLRVDSFGREVLVPFADNAAFVVNAIDYLSGSESLISLRARGVSKRPLEKFQALRHEATTREEIEKKILRQRLREVETRLAELEQTTPAGQAYSDASEAEIQNFRNEALAIQRTLNQVQRNLQSNIRALETKVIFLNMFVIPAFLLLLVLIRFGRSKRRWRS